ncbi:MAG: PASTA domain-containing protein [Flavobacteriales bacterium]|jgi:cell division protein FtsI (penicillin-binding protein 3)|nr:PASTA domain-containing protein [Flavobacteriales bacterium]
MKTKSNKKWSLIITFILVLILFSFISFKLFSIQYSDNISITYTHDPKFEILDAKRGSILSEDGRILSVYMPVYDVRLDLFTIDNVLFEKEVENLSEQLHQLFKDSSASQYEKGLLYYKEERYFLLKEDVSYVQLQKMRTFSIFNKGKNKGGFIPEIKSARIYPFESSAKVTIGRVNIEDDSIIPKNGIEFAFNEYLQGVPGKQLTQEISGKVLVPKKSDYNVLPQPGKDVVTTINIEFQDAAEGALRKKLKETHAKWGCAILMEVETGDIKAISNLSKGDDNLYYDSKNHALVSGIEPGSTLKLASFLSLLEDDYLKLSDIIDTKDESDTDYNKRRPEDPRDGYGKITLGDAFVVSSNVAISKEIFQNYGSEEGKKKFYSNLQKFQLTEPLELQLPYPHNHKLDPPSFEKTDSAGNTTIVKWSEATLPSMSRGYEMTISPIHILTFYNAIANNGKMVSPRFVTSIKDESGVFKSFPTTVISNKICSEETIQSIKPYMEQVISCNNCRTYKKQTFKENGKTYLSNSEIDEYQITGTAQDIHDTIYSIAGKTGTARIRYSDWNEQKESERSYSASFVGFFPVDKPKYSCIVVVYDISKDTIKNSTKSFTGGKVAAPVFKIISDKVYAFDSELQEYLSNPSNISEQVDRVTLEKLENSIISDKKKITAIKLDLEKGIMPDLTGMKLRDVLPEFENLNFKIEFEGAGKVGEDDTTPKKGKKIKKDQLIKIKLSW